MSEDLPRFSDGENVRYISTGKIGTVNKVIKGSRTYSYKVTIDGDTRTTAERFLDAVIDIEDNIIDDFLNREFGGHKDYRLFQTWFRLSKPLEGNLYSYLGSKTIFNPHQFKPLLRFLSTGSDERLFIADEVGVGKTIETGIILNEMIARGRLDYRTPILIICPNSLGPKWVREMKERFGLNFHLHNGNSLKYTLTTALKTGIYPPGYVFSIAGLQLIRHSEYRDLLKELDDKRDASLFGMVVIDEAHHMRNPDTDSNELGNTLSNMTEMILMLSATPLNLRNEDLYNQMHILNPIVFPDKTTFETLQGPVIRLNRIRHLVTINSPDARDEIFAKLHELRKEPLGEVIYSHPGVKKLTERLEDKLPLSPEEIVRYERLFVSLSPLYYSFTRTRKREAFVHQIHREVWELPIELSDEEMKFHNDALEAIKNYYLSQGGDSQALGFILNTHRRMISSCIPAMRGYFDWCIKENRMVVDEGEVLGEIEDDSQLNTIELDQTLKQEFLRLSATTEELEDIDSKYDQLKQMIDKILTNPETQKVIIFSFFIRTLEYLKRRLENDNLTVGMIHGKVPLQGNKELLGRYEIMDAFEKGKYKIFLSSEVGGEGLDFQYCHAIINYDLPYNPMRIEQRIGRIDRFGQRADKILVSNLFIKGTVDEEIYDRLYRRIHLVEEGVGSLEPILGNELSDIQTAIITGNLTEQQKDELSLRMDNAIVSAKIEMEEYEKYRKELLSDDYLAKPIDVIMDGDFVSPEDAIQLTEQCLSNWDNCKLIRTEHGCGEITLSEKVISKMEQFCRRPGNEGGYSELQPLLSPKKYFKVIFDGSRAEDNPDHIFLPPTGYWAKFLTHALEQERAILKTFRFGIKSSDANIPVGEYIVFLFEVRMEGVRTEIDFLGVPVSVKTKSVIDVNLNSLPRTLARVDCFDINYSAEEIDPNLFLDVARDYFEHILDDKRRVASEDNSYRVESRIAALKRSSDIKIKKLQEQKSKHIFKRSEAGQEPDFYLRMIKARIEKENIRLESKIKELQKHQDLSVDYNLEAVVCLEVHGD